MKLQPVEYGGDAEGKGEYSINNEEGKDEKQQKKETSKILPYAGKQIIGSIVLLALVISIFIFYYKYKKLNKYIK